LALLAVAGNARGADTRQELLTAAYTGVAVLVTVLIAYAQRQMHSVFVLAGQRLAIEEYAETQGILPRGLFTWERGPALEISGPRRLDGGFNWGRHFATFIFIGFAGAIYAFALLKLRDQGLTSVWFLTAAASALSGIGMNLAGFRMSADTRSRVQNWTSGELKQDPFDLPEDGDASGS
jgi:hypothetical protein